MIAPRVVIAFNPKSGSFSQSRLDQLCNAFGRAGYACDFADSYGEDLLTLTPGASHLCVVGGDGTLRDAIGRLRGIEGLPPINIFPGGTINLVARELLYPRDIEKYVARVISGQPSSRLFLGQVNHLPMLVCASIGPDSLAVASVSEQLKARIGRFAYAVALIQLLARWPRNKLEVRANGQTYQCEAAFVLKGRYFAGPFRLSKDAEMASDLLQVLLLPRARRRDYLQLILSVVAIPAFSAKHWIRFSASSADITGNTALPVQIDGDIAAALPVTIGVNVEPVDFA
jgi:diacylglycerol kinase (ATP)